MLTVMPPASGASRGTNNDLMTYRENDMSQAKKPLAMALGAAFLASAVAPMASAEVNPFSAQQLNGGYNLPNFDKHGGEGSCGEGNCGGDKGEGEGKCGEGKSEGEGKCGEGNCGGEKGEGEGNCGGEKGEGEGKCGEGKCGG